MTAVNLDTLALVDNAAQCTEGTRHRCIGDSVLASIFRVAHGMSRLFDFCSGLVDLVVCVRHDLGGGHRLALVGE